MLTHPVYIGHWCYLGAIERWNNHTPIIEIDVFMRAFNALSRYTLAGEENTDFHPAFKSTREYPVERHGEEPLLAGLI